MVIVSCCWELFLCLLGLKRRGWKIEESIVDMAFRRRREKEVVEERSTELPRVVETPKSVRAGRISQKQDKASGGGQ